jgi:hypothetical protein
MARLLVVLALSSGCTFATRPMLLKFERDGTPNQTGWTHVVTSSFTLATDFSAGVSQEAAQDIAGELAAVEAAFGNTAPRFETRLNVVLYQNGIDFEVRFGRELQAATRLDPTSNEHTVFLWGLPTRWVHHNMVGQAESSGSVLRQTLTHVVLARQISMTVLPQWLMHGLGGYVETFAWSDDGKSIELGAVNSTLLGWYRRDRSLGFNDATGPQHGHPGQEEAYLHAFDGYSWALVYTAINQRPQQLGNYIAALANGNPADPTMIFDGASPDAIDQEIEQFILRGHFALRTVAVETHELTAKVGPVSEQELTHLSPPPR